MLKLLLVPIKTNQLWVQFSSALYNLTLRTGHVFIPMQGWPSSFIVWTAQGKTPFSSYQLQYVLARPVVLQLRLYALYNRSKKVMLFVASLFIAEILSQAAILLYENIESASRFSGFFCARAY